MSPVQSVTIVDETGRIVIELSARGIIFTAPNGKKAALRLEVGTDVGSVKLVVQRDPLGTAAVDIVDNIA